MPERSLPERRGGRAGTKMTRPPPTGDVDADGGVAGAAADDAGAGEARRAFRERGAVEDVVAAVVEVVGEGVLVVGDFDVAAAGGFDVVRAVVRAGGRRQPVVAVGAGEARDVGVRHVRVAEDDDEAAARQQLLRLVAAAAQQVGEADSLAGGGAVGDGDLVVGLEVAFATHDALDESRDGLGGVDDDGVVVVEGEGAGPVEVVDGGVGEALAQR